MILLYLIGFQSIKSQSISGFVQDENNNPIPYVRVFVKNFENVGAISDEEGKYQFGCNLGTYDVIYKCIGFEEQIIKVTVADLQPTIQNVWMVQAKNELGTVEIKTKKRNIGWEITQRVIDHKKDIIQDVSAYTCNVYIKGVETFDFKQKEIKPEDSSKTPEPVVETTPDETGEPTDKFDDEKEKPDKAQQAKDRMNMVEINLTKYFRYPSDHKEIRNGYEKVGDPDQIYYTSTVQGEFNFYKNLISMENLHHGPITSPLHPSGILSYKYTLVEIIPSGGDTIYKIEVGARSVGTSTMEGHLWILKDEWVLTKVDLSMHKGNLKKYDDFRIVQEFEQMDSLWVVTKQEFHYSTRYGKETVLGSTNVFYSAFDFNPVFQPRFFNSEVGITTEEAYERDSSFWESIRPIPLTEDEQRKKFVLDSLEAIFTSDVYLDSIDSAFNKMTAIKVLFLGIEHRNRHKKTQWWITPVTGVFNPVSIGGPRAGPSVDFFKKWDNEQWIDLSTNADMGFLNADVRGSARLTHRYAPKKAGTWMAYYSRDASLFNQWDAWVKMMQKKNYYINNRAGIWNRLEIVNGLYTSVGASIERRSAFDTTYQFWNIADKIIDNEDKPTHFDPYYAFRTNIGFEFVPRQQYMSEPKRKVILGSRWPVFSAYWERGWNGVFNSIVDFDYLSFGIEQTIQIGTMGQSHYKFNTGTFINQDSVLYIDKKFFRQSDKGYFGWLFSDPMHSFQNLDSSYQTQNFYAEIHYIHHFNGAITNLIPFMKKTGINALMGAGLIYLPEHNNYFYTETFFGLERIFKVLRYRVRVGGYCILSVSSNEFSGLGSNPNNIQFKLSFDVMDERNLKFNF